MTEPAASATGLGLLGALVGSHAATVAIRWPGGAVGGRSRCDGCGRVLRAWALVPLVSWVMLRGRCGACGARIAGVHPAVEGAAVAVGVAAGLAAPGWPGASGAAFGWLLLTLAAIDLLHWRLPHVWTGALVATGLVAGVGTPVDRAIGAAAGFASLWIVARGYRALRGRMGLGGGDPWMFAGIGAWLGWRGLAPSLLVAAVLGLAVAALLRRGAQDRLPFGPLLAAGGFGVWLMYVGAA